MTTDKKYDVIVVGAGHNGLVAANYLAKAGRKVLVLERRDRAGGQLSAEELGGVAFDPLHPGAQLRPDIVRDLDLARHGWVAGASAPYIALQPDGRSLVLSTKDVNLAATVESIRQFSENDAQRWPDFVAFMDRAAVFLDAAYRTPMPRLPHVGFEDGWPLAKLAWTLRRLGGKDMFRVIRMMSMSTVEFTEEWFESEPVRAAIAAVGIHGYTLGSMSAGTGYTLMHNWLHRGGLAHRQIAGGSSTVTKALVAALKANGGQLRTSAGVERIVIEKMRATGVRLDSGEELLATTVFSAADPKHTLLGLVGAPELPTEFVWHVQSIKMRGSLAKVHLRTDGSHGLPAGTLAIAPTLKDLERAYDAAKYGEIAQRPYLEVTTAGDIVSIHVQSAPHKLRGLDWHDARATVERIAIDMLAAQFPALKASIRETRTIAAPDLEREWGLTEGDLSHGQPILDQMFFMRPLPGWSNHATPIDALYLCGNGMHGGAGISGAPGRNAAQMLLKRKA
ncbi:phytoene desaturase family protein [Noviluteimonas gilva]|uniref:Pyridine nucleotide-disulfide oxidoreductase domain-containing protein 2 n=1 Tax=Noviluteimonas gilva TaxID=2682097 RepID=A0A7C9LKN9_9GAMM|nr:NAD(P)/FAD-dependent oxidoreductase [Lysobacter gilvus]MUV13644.1 FAD-dependent oxidoreductase [Lysobacter gilvus]